MQEYTDNISTQWLMAWFFALPRIHSKCHIAVCAQMFTHCSDANRKTITHLPDNVMIKFVPYGKNSFFVQHFYTFLSTSLTVTFLEN